MPKKKIKLKRVDQVEFKGKDVYVRPLDDKDRDLFETGYLVSAQSAISASGPKTAPEGLIPPLPSPSPALTLMVDMVCSIVYLSACDHSGKRLFKITDQIRMKEALLRNPPIQRVTAFVIFIASEALITSKWVRAGKDPVYRFLKGYLGQYFPDKESFDLLLAGIPHVPDDSRFAATERIRERHPLPIHIKRWPHIEKDIVSRWNERDLDEQILTAASIAAIQARRKTQVGAPEKELLLQFKRAYRKEAENGLEIDRSTKKKTRKSKDGQLSPTENSTAIPRNAPLEDLVELDHIEPLYLRERFEQLSPEDKLTVMALFKAGGDQKNAAKNLGIGYDTMRKRLSRIRKHHRPDE